MLDKKIETTAQLAALRSFARLMGLDEKEAVTAYEEELRRLSAAAKVSRYLGVLAEKRARDRLAKAARDRRSPTLLLPAPGQEAAANPPHVRPGSRANALPAENSPPSDRESYTPVLTP